MLNLLKTGGLVAKNRKDTMNEAQIRLEIENKILREMLQAQTLKTAALSSGVPETAKVIHSEEDPNAGVDWKKVQRECPKCETPKMVLPDFGLRKVRGISYSHSWCKDCRSKATIAAGGYKRKRAYKPRGSAEFTRARSYSPRKK